MKLDVNFGELSHSYKLSDLPKEVPIVSNTDSEKIIGKAILEEKENAIIADVTLDEVNQFHLKKLSKILECGVNGKVTSRDGDKITGFEILSISVNYKKL